MVWIGPAGRRCNFTVLNPSGFPRRAIANPARQLSSPAVAASAYAGRPQLRRRKKLEPRGLGLVADTISTTTKVALILEPITTILGWRRGEAGRLLWVT